MAGRQRSRGLPVECQADAVHRGHVPGCPPHAHGADGDAGARCPESTARSEWMQRLRCCRVCFRSSRWLVKVPNQPFKAMGAWA
eukprot:621841-Alexandrium_andersonii.AAC.1